MRLFLIGVLISFNAMALSWTSLEVGNKYRLNQSFQLKQVERSGSLLDFRRGERLHLKEIVPLSAPGVMLTLYVFHPARCPGEELVTEMEVLEVKGTSPLVELGAQFEKCELNVYLENKDLYSKSLFN